MAAYRWVYDSRHLQADCQELGLAPEPYAWQSSMGYLYLYRPYTRSTLMNSTEYMLTILEKNLTRTLDVRLFRYAYIEINRQTDTRPLHRPLQTDSRQ